MNHEISGSTGFACVLGHPIEHSISPAMHNISFEALGLNYVYLAFDITEEHLQETVEGLRAMNCLGWNATMPLKTAIIPYMDELSKASVLSHSVNTVINDGGRLIGDTTDGVGYMDSVRDAGFDISGGRMVLLGAGGAATSICIQAALDGLSEISIFKRKNASFAQTAAFAEHIARETDCRIRVCDLADRKLLRDALAAGNILVNATSVGMKEQPYSLIPKEFLHRDLIVSDIIYHPAMTPLLVDAAEAGCPYFNGKYMLLFQGAKSFQLWTGQKMPVEKVRQALFA